MGILDLVILGSFSAAKEPTLRGQDPWWPQPFLEGRVKYQPIPSVRSVLLVRLVFGNPNQPFRPQRNPTTAAD